MNKPINPRLIGESKVRIGDISYIVRSFESPDNPTATTAERLIMSLLESKIKNMEVQTA